MKNIFMIGNTHFDPVWTWEWKEAMYAIHATFRSALDRMDEDEAFIYSFASPPVFAWIQKIDPEMFGEIQQRVQEGRWELNEGWWVQPDCFSAGGESYARQSLYAQQYLMDNFGQYAKTVFNVDSFGHNSQIPQILKKSHMEYYCMCRPEKWFFEIASAYFLWRGKDGSCVKAFRVGQFSEIYNKDMGKNVSLAEENMHDSTCDELMLYGVTNHGGAPTQKAIRDIHTLNAQKEYSIEMHTVEEYFKAQGMPTAVVDTEMLTQNFGPYVNANKIKKMNRAAEYAVTNGEKASVIAGCLLGTAYEGQKLTECWKNILFNQFHDILGGACHKEAYYDAENQLGGAIFTAEEIMHLQLAAVTKRIKTPGKNGENPWNLVVWNLNDKPYDGYLEAEMQWLHEFPGYAGGIVLEDADGNRFPCQIIMENSVIPEFRSRVLFRAVIPSMGYKLFKVIQTGEEVSEDISHCLQFETDHFRVEIEKNSGLIRKLYSKRVCRGYENILYPQCFEDIADTECFNTTVYGKPCEPFTLLGIETTEQGIHRQTIKASFGFRSSRLTLYYTFYKDTDYFDIKYYVNWNEAHTVLKLMSHTDFANTIVAAPFASEQRGMSQTDMPMGEWLCVGNEREGLSYITNSVFAYNRNEESVGFSILRSCIYGEMTLGNDRLERDYPIMEQGVLEGSLRIVVHMGTCYDNNVPAMARSFNNVPIVISESNHDGIFPSSDSFVSVDADTVAISAVKKAENGQAHILRMYELAGQEQTVHLRWFGKVFEIDVKPFEIKTLCVTGDEIREVLITEDAP